MEISYKGNILDTSKNIEISYLHDSDIIELLEALADMDIEGAALPSKIGIVSKYYPFLSNLSIIENIILPLEYHEHNTKKEAIEKVEQRLESLGLTGVMHSRKEAVNKTELYRAMFLRGIVLNPEVVLMSDFKYSLTLKEFKGVLPSLMGVMNSGTRMWIGVGEGHALDWGYDMEVALGC